MDRGSSKHQAYIVNRMEHDGTKVVKTEKLNTGKKEQEEKKEMKISHLLT
jgi:hypothetical protein